MRDIFKGSTSHSEYVVLVDSATGLPKTGIADTSVTGSYVRTRAARTAISMSALGAANSAYSSGGWFEVDSANAPGLYRVDVPDLAFATGADQVYLTIKATGCKTETKEFRLVDWNNQVAAIPNVAAGANGGLPTGNASGQVVVSSVAAGGIAAAAFAAGALDAVWSVATRLLTAGTNIVLAKGTGVTGFNDLDAAGVRSAVGLASADLDTQLGALPTAAENASQVRAELATELGRVDVAVSSRGTGDATAANQTTINNNVLSRLATAGYTAPPTVGAIADQVWDEPLSGHAASGSTGEALGAAGSGGAPTANQNADALLDRADAIETGLTLRQAHRLIAAALAGEVSGAATTLITIRNAVADSKARITASVDENGNRTAVNTDVT